MALCRHARLAPAVAMEYLSAAEAIGGVAADACCVEVRLLLRVLEALRIEDRSDAGLFDVPATSTLGAAERCHLRSKCSHDTCIAGGLHAAAWYALRSTTGSDCNILVVS